MEAKPTSLRKDINHGYDGYPVRRKIENTEKQLYHHLEGNSNIIIYLYIYLI